MDDDRDFPEKLHDHLTQANWPDLRLQGNKLSTTHEGEEVVIVDEIRNQYMVRFIGYNSDNGTYELFGGVSTVSFDTTAEIQDFIYFGGLRSRQAYGLNRSSLVKAILQLKDGKYGGCEHVNVSESHTRLSYSNTTHILKVPAQRYSEVLATASQIQRQAKSYQKSIERHLINEANHKYLGVETQRTTNIAKGEFAFLVHRFNLETKNKKADFVKYLDEADVNSIQNLTMSMIEEEVFSLDYLRKLDSYFLKEKLDDIVTLGRAIIDLKSTDLTTEKARLVIQRLFKDEATIPDIRQLENLWQKYFEKYLLYIIFTYKQIFSKVTLDLEGDKKEPDFLGINHYNGIDAIEIKTHLKPALVKDRSHDNFAFSSELSKAIIQTTNYIDAIKERAFRDPEDINKLTSETEEENLYRPRGIIIISSKDRLVKNQSRLSQGDKNKITRDFTKLRNSLGSIEILTFDEVLNIADNYSTKIAPKATEQNE